MIRRSLISTDSLLSASLKSDAERINNKISLYKGSALALHKLMYGDKRLAPYVSKLRHPLSTSMAWPRVDAGLIIRNNNIEAEIYRKWLVEVGRDITIEDLDRLSLLTGINGKKRLGDIYFKSYDCREGILMISARESLQRLSDLIEWHSTGQLGEGISAGIAALVLLNNAHAYADGNGRMGRAIFNYSLHKIGMSKECYIPLKPLYFISKGGYEIRLRQVELHGMWKGIFEYHCDLMDTYRAACLVANQ